MGDSSTNEHEKTADNASAVADDLLLGVEEVLSGTEENESNWKSLQELFSATESIHRRDKRTLVLRVFTLGSIYLFFSMIAVIWADTSVGFIRQLFTWVSDLMLNLGAGVVGAIIVFVLLETLWIRQLEWYSTIKEAHLQEMKAYSRNTTQKELLLKLAAQLKDGTIQSDFGDVLHEAWQLSQKNADTFRDTYENLQAYFKHEEERRALQRKSRYWFWR